MQLGDVVAQLLLADGRAAGVDHIHHLRSMPINDCQTEAQPRGQCQSSTASIVAWSQQRRVPLPVVAAKGNQQSSLCVRAAFITIAAIGAFPLETDIAMPSQRRHRQTLDHMSSPQVDDSVATITRRRFRR